MVDPRFFYLQLRTRFWKHALAGVAVLFVIGYILWLAEPPAQFMQTAAITVPEGTSVREIVSLAKADGLVRSKWLLYVVLVAAHDHKAIYAGTYQFNQPATVFGVVHKLISKDVETDLVKLTIPEGSTNAEAAQIAYNTLTDFSTSTYLALASSSQGQLFPDTYLVPPTYSPAALINLQKKTFQEQVAPLQSAFASSSLQTDQVIILASLLQREANTATSMAMVSGILQNRLQLGMPLQVDASVSYGLNEPQNALSAADLKINTPYNTYIHKGLPPTPIDNPGLTAIKAALMPSDTKNLYYITDTNGKFHYAKTLSAHNSNVALYLK